MERKGASPRYHSKDGRYGKYPRMALKMTLVSQHLNS